MDFYFANSLRHLGEALKRLSGNRNDGVMYLPNASQSFSETDKEYVIRCIKDAIEIIEYSIDENAKAVASDSAKDKKRRPTIIRKMLAASKEREPDIYRDIDFAWVDSHGRQCATDAFRAFRLNPGSHVKVAERPSPPEKPDMLDKIFANSDDFTGEVPLPKKSELIACIALQKGWSNKERVPTYIFGVNGMTVDAEYLLDLMEFFPEVDRLVYDASGGRYPPLFAKGFDGDAVLLPMRSAS